MCIYLSVCVCQTEEIKGTSVCPFTTLLESQTEKRFPSCLLLCFIPPSLRALHSPLLSPPLSFLTVSCVHIQHSPFPLALPPCVSPSVIICDPAVLYCWEANTIIILLLSSSILLPLFLPLWLPLIHYPSLTTLLCRCDVDATSGHPSRLTVPHYPRIYPPSPLPSVPVAVSFRLQRCAAVKKRQSLSSSIKSMSLSCSFFPSTLSYFCHSCFLTSPPPVFSPFPEISLGLPPFPISELLTGDVVQLLPGQPHPIQTSLPSNIKFVDLILRTCCVTAAYAHNQQIQSSNNFFSTNTQENSLDANCSTS